MEERGKGIWGIAMSKQANKSLKNSENHGYIALCNHLKKRFPGLSSECTSLRIECFVSSFLISKASRGKLNPDFEEYNQKLKFLCENLWSRRSKASQVMDIIKHLITNLPSAIC